MNLSQAPPLTEAEEQKILVRWLNINGLLYTHVANEALGGKNVRNRAAYQNTLRALGVKKGVPDFLIFSVPPATARMGVRGVAIELKRSRRGAKTSDEQKWWLEQLRAEGWKAEVCKGADAAIQFLERLGYGRRL